MCHACGMSHEVEDTQSLFGVPSDSTKASARETPAARLHEQPLPRGAIHPSSPFQGLGLRRSEASIGGLGIQKPQGTCFCGHAGSESQGFGQNQVSATVPRHRCSDWLTGSVLKQRAKAGTLLHHGSFNTAPGHASMLAVLGMKSQGYVLPRGAQVPQRGPTGAFSVLIGTANHFKAESGVMLKTTVCRADILSR